MFILIRTAITATYGILDLQEIRLREVHAPGIQLMSILLLVGDTTQEIDMVQTNRTIVCQRILHQEVSIGTSALGEFLVTLVKIYTITLNPGRYPSLVLGMSLTVREVQFVVQFVVLVLESNHLHQIDISRTCDNHTVNDGVTS